MKNFVRFNRKNFTHDCNYCQYLGSDNEHDYYYCNNNHVKTVIARYGNDGPDYVSGIEFAENNQPLSIALALAKVKGYIE